MPDVKCIHAHCGAVTKIDEVKVSNFPTHVTFRCPRCSRLTPTGFEDEIRFAWEDIKVRNFPKVATARAIGLSLNIYKTANQKLSTISMKKTREKILSYLENRAHPGLLTGGYAPPAGVIDVELFSGRSHRGLVDGSVSAAVVVFDNGSATPSHSIIVVFRGSDGDAKAVHHPSANVDWRANFDNAMVQTGYSGSQIRIHRGFNALLTSYRDSILRTVVKKIQEYTTHNVIVTGHSLGGGLAQLFTHWIDYKIPFLRPTCLAFSPPRGGNIYFALDFYRRITEINRSLPMDSGNHSGSQFFVFGNDPIFIAQRRSFQFESVKQRRELADLPGSAGLIQKAMAASSAERSRSNPADVYFYPKHLNRLTALPAPVLRSDFLDHDPRFVRDSVLRGMNN